MGLCPAAYSLCMLSFDVSTSRTSILGSVTRLEAARVEMRWATDLLRSISSSTLGRTSVGVVVDDMVKDNCLSTKDAWGEASRFEVWREMGLKIDMDGRGTRTLCKENGPFYILDDAQQHLVHSLFDLPPCPHFSSSPVFHGRYTLRVRQVDFSIWSISVAMLAGDPVRSDGLIPESRSRLPTSSIGGAPP